MTKVEHRRAPWRDPSRERSAADKIKAGLEDAIAFAKGDTARGRIVTPPDVRPPPEHAGVEWHWVGTPQNLDGEPMRYFLGLWWTFGSAEYLEPKAAARAGWRYIGPCEPPSGGFW